MLALNRLDRRDRGALVAQIAGGTALPDEVVNQIVMAKPDSSKNPSPIGARPAESRWPFRPWWKRPRNCKRG